MTDDQRLTPEGAVAAINFALQIEDFFDRTAFLQAWQHGDLAMLDEWPEFTGSLDDRVNPDG